MRRRREGDGEVGDEALKDFGQCLGQTRRARGLAPLAYETQHLQVQEQIAWVLFAIERTHRREEQPATARRERRPVAAAHELQRERHGRVPLRLHERAHVALLKQSRGDAERRPFGERQLRDGPEAAQDGTDGEVVAETVREEADEVLDGGCGKRVVTAARRVLPEHVGKQTGACLARDLIGVGELRPERGDELDDGDR